MTELILPDHPRDNRRPECYACGRIMDSVISTAEFALKEGVFIVSNVNAWRCPRCGTETYSAREAGMIEDAIMEAVGRK